MEDYTHIMFLDLDDKYVITKVDGEHAEINRWYPRESVFTFDKRNENHFGDPLATIKWKAKNEEIESNVASLNIYSFINKDEEINGSDSFVNIINENSKELSINDFNHISGIDRIKVQGVNGKNIFYFNDAKVRVNQILSNIDLERILLKDFDFCGENIYELKYYPGNDDEMSAETISLFVSVYQDTGVFKKRELKGVKDDNGLFVYESRFYFNYKWMNSIYRLDIFKDFNINTVDVFIDDNIINTDTAELISKNSLDEDYKITIKSQEPLLGLIRLSMLSINSENTYIDRLNESIIFNMNEIIDDTDDESETILYFGSTNSKVDNSEITNELMSVLGDNNIYEFYADKRHNTIVIPIDYEIEKIESSFHENLINNFIKINNFVTIDNVEYKVLRHKSVIPLNAQIIFTLK